MHTYRSGADFSHYNPVIACLIVDYQMPSLTGLDVVSELPKHGRDVPAIIMITAATDPSLEHPRLDLASGKS